MKLLTCFGITGAKKRPRGRPLHANNRTISKCDARKVINIFNLCFAKVGHGILHPCVKSDCEKKIRNIASSSPKFLEKMNAAVVMERLVDKGEVSLAREREEAIQ